MTDDEIDQVIEAQQGNALTRRWRGFVTRFGRTRMGTWLKQKTARWQTIVAILAIASGFPLVIGSIGATNDRLRERDLRDVSHEIYFANVVAYSQAVTAYDLCIDGVARSDANRAQWVQLADIIAALDQGSGRVTAFADQIRQGPLLAAVPRTVADCPNPGPAPSSPSP